MSKNFYTVKTKHPFHTYKLNKFQERPRCLITNSTKPNYVSLGGEYELEVITYLSKLDLILNRRGQADDKGIDFRGYWPLSGTKLNVVGQCKRTINPVKPSVVRELEGVLSSELKDTVGILSSSCGFTDKTVNRCFESKLPLVLLQVVTENQLFDKSKVDPHCKLCLWNWEADKLLRNKVKMAKVNDKVIFKIEDEIKAMV